MTSPLRRIELAWGRTQLTALHRGVGAIAQMRRAHYRDALGELDLLVRPGRDPRAVPLLCVHGFGGDKETWLLLAAALGRERGVIAIDLPGHGRSSLPDVAVTIAVHAQAALRVMDHLKVPRAIVCGNSMGGGVALRLALDHPERVAALALISSVGSDVHQHAAVAAWRAGKNPLIPDEHEIDEFIDTALDGPTLIPRSVIRYVATTRARAARKLRRLFDEFAAGHGAEGVPDELERITAPTLVLHGARDKIIDRSTAEALCRRLPRSELHHMPKVGHAPQLEAPRRTAAILRDFLRRLERAGDLR
ncbi:MAG TPA: alpha/beta fold hydrolase [Kofleriaceae bacterium]|nr:alpha/beta fold hydrolase [Kofleriaceae bacterium]